MTPLETMWQQANHNVVPAEEGTMTMNTGTGQGNGDTVQPLGLRRRQSSMGLGSQHGSISSTSSQASLGMLANQRSISLGSVNHHHSASALNHSGNNTGTTNEAFRLGSYSNFPQSSQAPGGAGGNMFLEHPKVNPLLAAAQLRSITNPLPLTMQMQQQHRPQQAASVPQVVTAAALGQHPRMGGAGLTPFTATVQAQMQAQQQTRQQQRQQQQRRRHSSSLMPMSENGSDSLSSASIPAKGHGAQRTSPTSAADVATGPSKLYRLIASPQGPVDWDRVLRRAKSHPHEACFYDPNAGGHVYALHRLLRRTGDDDDSDSDDDEEMSGQPGRPPVAVVEAVMRACPRAVTRKQAMIDEEDLDSDGGGGNHGGSAIMDWQGPNNLQLHAPNQAQPQPNGNANQGNNNIDEDDDQSDGGSQQDRPNDDDEGADEVRFEYPLAIACECEQDGEVVRLLASYLSRTKPVYRSEVFRSLDYASLPNSLVRILLEEYAGCVLERGMNSEATEGDDDDCPLEQVLFWWDDPDMMGMEEDIASYPNCNMKEDLCDLYEKLRMMLYAATNGTMAGYDDSKESFQVLHHVLRIVSEGGIGDVKFPNDFAHAVLLLAKFIQRERPGMFEERDETGSLPLHIAVSGERLLLPSAGKTDGAENDGGEGHGDDDEEGNAPQHENNDQDAMDADDGGAAAQAQNVNRLLAGPVGFRPAPEGQQAAIEEEEEEDDSEEEDEDGDEAIDVTSNGPSDMEIVKLLLSQHPASIRLRDSQTGSLPVHLTLQHHPRTVEAIEHFLELYPRSVTMPDGDGRLPLHTALIKRSPAWHTVLDMAPNMLEAKDPMTGLLPFQLAAMSNPETNDPQKQDHEQGEIDSLSTTFNLLRMSPCLASGLGNVKPRPQSLIEQQIMVRYKPRVTKLEEENENLRRRVEELELELLAMRMGDSAMNTNLTNSCRPHLKKRKSATVAHMGGPPPGSS